MLRAPYASSLIPTHGRFHPEQECSMRTPYARDRDRIIHSAAFRRLEYKTQVFINHEGDHYRTRLTHSLEVGQLARAMCRSLHLDEDVGEAVALAHDLGHPPFGHAGEDGLKHMMQCYDGFDHNAQAIHILTHLEQRYASFDGLNLTWEVLEGVAKHNGPLHSPYPAVMTHYDKQHSLELSTYASLEAQIAALADDIAYHNHDIEDGVRAGFFSLDDLRFIPMFAQVLDEVDSTYGAVEVQRRVHEVTRRMMFVMVRDVIDAVQQAVARDNPQTAYDIRHADHATARFSAPMQETQRTLKKFLMEHMYMHYRVNRMSSKAKRIVGELFTAFHKEPQCLPTEWRRKAEPCDDVARARVVCDFIAGMTDRFALQEHHKLFGLWEKT